MGSITAQLMLVTLLSKCSGLLREMIFGAAFGTSMIKDIYVVSEATTAVLFGFLFMSIESCFIPMYNRIRNAEGRESADAFTANLTHILLLLTTIIIVLGIFFMGPIIRMMAKGFSGERFTQTVAFARIEIFGLYFAAMNCCFISYLNIYNNFMTPATTGILLNLVTIIFAILSAKLNNLYLLAVGAVVSTGLQYVFFPGAVRKTGYRHRLRLDFHDPYVREILRMALPVMLSVVVSDLSIIIDKTIATTVATEGGVSALDYGVKIYQLAYGIIIVSIVTAMFPRMSRMGQANDLRALKAITVRSITTGLLLVVPATVGLMLYATPVVRLFFERGAFTALSTAMTAGALFWYAPMLIALMFSSIGTRAFYSIGDTRTPVHISMLQVGINIVLNLILSRFFGINGLAAATSISSFCTAFLTLAFLRRHLGSLPMQNLAKSFIKMSGAAALMAYLSYQVFRALHQTNLALFAAIFFAILIYMVLLLFLNIPEVKHLVNAAYHKLARTPRKKRRY